MKAGYFVGGTGITNGTTIFSIDSPTQITMGANATSTGSGTVIVSPWALGDGTTTFTLPDVTTAGRYRRSRTGSIIMGTLQTDATKLFSHTHGISITSAGQSVLHHHGASGSTSGQSNSHGHSYTPPGATSSLASGGFANAFTALGSATTGLADADHSHTFSVTTTIEDSTHTHLVSGTSSTPSTSGDTETRPVSIIVLTCIKT
jgi:hypothetical protein